MALDEIDKSGTTQLRISSIEKIASEPLFDEPPFDEPPFFDGQQFNDPDPAPTPLSEQQFIGEVGTYDQFIDPVDIFVAPLDYNEGLEGIIDLVSGDELILNIYDANGLYDSYSVGSSPVSFNFQSDTFTMEIIPSNLNVLTEYALSFNIGQVYDPN